MENLFARARRLLAVSGLLALLATPAIAEWKSPSSSPTGAAGFRKRAEGASRWTLKNWLEQKERNRMMDLWLGMYAPSPYELIFTLGQNDYGWLQDSSSTRINYKSLQGSLAFYALILGIEVAYENNTNERFVDTQGLINIRAAGNSNQSTHINLFGGLRNHKVENGIDLRAQPVAGVEMDLYIEKHIGIHFRGRYDFLKDSTDSGNLSGQMSEAGVFFDVAWIRIFGNYFSHVTKVDTTSLGGNLTQETRTGYNYGFRLFF